MDSLELIELRQHLEDYEILLLEHDSVEQADLLHEYIENLFENA
jgi:hypothetical protein